PLLRRPAARHPDGGHGDGQGPLGRALPHAHRGRRRAGPEAVTPMTRAVVAALLLVSASVAAGCFGGQARTQWAFTMTQLDQAAVLGRTGAGVGVAILDTGIDPT